MKKIILGAVCGVALLSAMSSSLNVEASSKDSFSSKEGLLLGSPFDMGYFADKWAGNSANDLDPNPRTKLISGAAVSISININSEGIPVQCRAYSPSTGEAGPWVYVGVTGSAQLPNSIPAGQTVIPQAMSATAHGETYISGNWNSN